MNYNSACQLLGLEKGFTPPQLKKAYYKEALKYHQDKNKDDKTAEEKFKEIGSAYEFLQKNKKIENLSYSEILKKIFNMDLLLHKKPYQILYTYL